MNPLETYLKSHGIDFVKAMNLLQDNGVISDNCITPRDVADADCAKAIAVIAGNLDAFGLGQDAKTRKNCDGFNRE